MRIGIMLRHLRDQRGGIGTLTRNLLDGLLRIDPHNEYFLLYAHDEMKGLYVKHDNVVEVVAPASSKLVWDQVVVPSLAETHHFDVILNLKLSVPLRTRCKTAFVMAGGDWFVFPQNYKLHDRLYHRVFAPLYFRRASAIISISHSATEDILGAINVDAAKIKTIHLGVSDFFRPIQERARLAAVRAKYGLPERFILWVGQIYPMKNVGGLIRAYAALRGKVPHKLVLVGKPELKYRQELRLIDHFGMEQDVILTGWVPDEDLPLFYNLSDLFVFPSLYEGFGLPILEAMACGCPVVTSERGATREVAGDAAVLIDPTQPEAIAEAVRTCLTNSALRQRLIERGFKRARAFSWENCAQETLELLEGLKDGSGSKMRSAAMDGPSAEAR